MKAKEKKNKDDDITFMELTEMIKPFITGEKGNTVTIKPKIVLEIAYEEIQKSPNYGSGYALRFPRLVKLRPDKSIDDSDDLDRIE